MNFYQLQSEVSAWSQNNFGDQPAENTLLGMIEELGELSHAVLKTRQDIRSNENQLEKIVDAVGDIVIYTMDYCGRESIDAEKFFNESAFMTIINEKDYGDSVNIIFRLCTCIGRIAKQHTSENGDNALLKGSWVGVLLILLEKFCAVSKIDFEKIIWSTWGQVRTRDWKKNRIDGK